MGRIEENRMVHLMMMQMSLAQTIEKTLIIALNNGIPLLWRLIHFQSELKSFKVAEISRRMRKKNKHYNILHANIYDRIHTRDYINAQHFSVVSVYASRFRRFKVINDFHLSSKIVSFCWLTGYSIDSKICFLIRSGRVWENTTPKITAMRYQFEC